MKDRGRVFSSGKNRRAFLKNGMVAASAATVGAGATAGAADSVLLVSGDFGFLEVSGLVGVMPALRRGERGDQPAYGPRRRLTAARMDVEKVMSF